jgi:hypothetical protein
MPASSNNKQIDWNKLFYNTDENRLAFHKGKLDDLLDSLQTQDVMSKWDQKEKLVMADVLTTLASYDASPEANAFSTPDKLLQYICIFSGRRIKRI